MSSKLAKEGIVVSIVIYLVETRKCYQKEVGAGLIQITRESKQCLVKPARTGVRSQK